MYREALIDADENYQRVGKIQKNTFVSGSVEKSERITANMSDNERANILRNKIITNVPAVEEISTDIVQKIKNISSWEDINNLFGSKKSTLIQKLASEFGVFKRYLNSDINISFEFSKNNFRESYHKQRVNYEQFAKMFSVFDSVVKNAVGIEVHNRNIDGYKSDVTLKNVYVLMSAFEDGELIIPVKLEVKEFKDKQNTLYVAISLEGIKKTEVSKQGTTENGVAQNSRSATIIIRDLFSKINPKDISFLKYIPNEFLTDEQKNTTDEGDVRLHDRSVFSEYNKPITLEDIKALRDIGRKSINDFSTDEVEVAQKWAYKFYQQLGTKSPFFRRWFGDWRAHDKSKVDIVQKSISKPFKAGKIKNLDTNSVISWGDQVKGETKIKYGVDSDVYSYLENIEQIAENAVLLDTVVSVDSSKHKMPNTEFMHSFYAIVNDSSGVQVVVKLLVEEAYNNKMTEDFSRAYELQEIKKVATLHTGVHSNEGGLTRQVTTNYSISELFDFVKQNDKNFNPKPVNEALINKADGTPKVFYHGTKESFTEFVLQDNPKFGRALGDGFYFTSDYDKAFKFANGLFSKGKDRGGIIMPVYLKMENPYIIERDADRTQWKKEYNKGNYDGIIDLKNDTYYVEESNKIKSAEDGVNIGTFSEAENDIRFSERDYSYEALANKPDMKLTLVGESVPGNRADVVALAKRNAASVGKTNKDGSVSVYVDDIGAEVLLGTDGLKHGLRRVKNLQENANFIVTLKAGEILKNSIKINEILSAKENASGAYVLIGVAKNKIGNVYIVRSVVNQFNNELASIDVLYAVNAKKEELAATKSPRYAAEPLSVTSSTISISDLLNLVNKKFSDVLPESVLKHFGYESRPEGDLGENVLFSERDSSAFNRSILANSLESAAQNDIERKKLAQYKEKISLIEAEEKRLAEIQKQLFTKDAVEPAQRKDLQFEARQISNRITTYDRQLLNLEATTALKNILSREKSLAMKKQKQKDTEALMDADENYQRVGKIQKNTTDEGDVQLCERDSSPNRFNPKGKTLKEQLEEAFDTAISKERRYVYIGEFTQTFIDKLSKYIEIKKHPIVMNYRDAYLSMERKENGKYQGDGINYHNLGVEGLEAALRTFDNPEYVLLSKAEGKIELVLEGRDYKNRQLFSIVEINAKAQYNKEFLDAHVVTSVYGNRGLKNRLSVAKSEDRVIYDKKEESTQGMPQVQYERDINANSSKYSIRNSNEKVNKKIEDGIKYSNAGERSATANKSLLSDAQKMLDDGINPEKIRKKTGWFKGYDGRWRYEIDDSKLNITLDSYFKNPQILKYYQMFSDFYENSSKFTENKMQELLNLGEVVHEIIDKPINLKDAMEHDELFKAYPELENIKLKFQVMTGEADGIYDPLSKCILIKFNIYKDIESLKYVLIHEVQHAIQDIEMFANGANVKYWRNVVKNLNNEYIDSKANADEYSKQLKDQYGEKILKKAQDAADMEMYLCSEDISVESYMLTTRKLSKIDKVVENSEYQMLFKKTVGALFKFGLIKKKYDKLKGRNALELYKATAGEVEAYDVSDRLNLSKEERLKKSPNINRDDVVFTKDFDRFENTKSVMFSERDYPIDAEVESIVNSAYLSNKGTMNEFSEITSEQNKAINRLVNQINNDSYRGKYEGGKHKFSNTAIRHIIAEHGDFLREGLRAQLPMTLTDIARHLSAIKDNKNPSSIKATKTKRGNPSILTSYEVNGYTLYAEEITKSLSKNLPSDLIGHTMYKAPTLATAAFYTTSAQTQPKRQNEVLCNYYISNNTDLSMGNFVVDNNGNPAQLYFISENGFAKSNARNAGLIALSSDSTNFTDKSGQIAQGYVMCKKPFYITHDNRVLAIQKLTLPKKSTS